MGTGLLDKLRGKQAAATADAAADYAKLVASAADGTLGDDAKTLAHVEAVLAAAGKSIDGLALDVAHAQEKRTLEAIVDGETAARARYAAARDELAECDADRAAALERHTAKYVELAGELSLAGEALKQIGNAQQRLKDMQRAG